MFSFRKINEAVLAFLVSCCVIQLSKIVKINFFTFVPELDIQYYIKKKNTKPQNVLALRIYELLIPTIYRQNVIPL